MDLEVTKIQEDLQPTVKEVLDGQKAYDPLKDDDYLTEGTFLLNKLSNAKKSIEDRRIEFTKPLNESLRSINKFFKTFSDPIAQADAELRKKLAEHRKILEGMQIESGTFDPDARKKIGGIVAKDVWTFEIIDSSQVPDQYKVVDEVKIRAAIRSGVREIAGIKIYQDKQISL